MFLLRLKSMIKYSPDVHTGGNAVDVKTEVTKFMPILDELYEQEAITSMFEVDDAVWDGTKSIMIPTIDVDGNADYSRSEGYAEGGISVEYQRKVLTHDRGRRFNIDAVEANEINFDLIAAGMSKFERRKNVPEVDAIRFAALAQLAGTKKSESLTTSDAAIASYDDAEMKALEKGLSLANSIMFVSAAYYKLIKNFIKPSINANANSGTLDRSIKTLDNGLKLRIVPNDRFYDQIKLLTGKVDEEAGGYEAIKGTSHQINFLLVDLDTPRAVTKRKVTKVINPEENQKFDGFSVYYRNFHDIYIEDGQAPLVYVSISTTAVA